MGKWRRHGLEFKKQAVEKMKGSGNVHELARELGVERKLLHTWKYRFEGRPEKNHANYGEGKAPPDTVAERLKRENQALKEALGQKAAELDFLAGALRGVKQDRRNSGFGGEPVSTPKSGRRPPRKAN